MRRTRLAPRGYCPPHEMRFAVVTRDGWYLTTKDYPLQYDANIDDALLWDRWRDAEDFLGPPNNFIRHRCRVVQVREEV